MIASGPVTHCADYNELPLEQRPCRVAGEFRLVHKDRFDRVLVAQAMIQGIGW